MKKFFRFIISKIFWVNLLLALGITFVFILGITQFLRVYTNHGRSCAVPDLIGMQEPEVKDLLNQLDLKYEIVDSVYTENVALGAVAEQYPRSEFHVKSGRTIYLVKNAELPEMIPVPKVKDLSLRRAKSTLEAYGFVLGKLEYIPDIGVNVVLKIKNNGNLVNAGDELVKGSVVDLVLGQGLSDDKTYVPNVEGLSVDAAISKLNEKFLNVGAVIYAEDVKTGEDSMVSKIYKQYPAFDTVRNVNLGFSVDLWLTNDSSLIPAFIPDSILMDSLRREVDSLFVNTEDDE